MSPLAILLADKFQLFIHFYLRISTVIDYPYYLVAISAVYLHF